MMDNKLQCFSLSINFRIIQMGNKICVKLGHDFSFKKSRHKDQHADQTVVASATNTLSIGSLDQYRKDHEQFGSLAGSTSSCTIPSAFKSLDSQLSVKDDEYHQEESIHSIIISSGQFEHIYELYKSRENIQEDYVFKFTADSLNVIQQLFDDWKTDLISFPRNYVNFIDTEKGIQSAYQTSKFNILEDDVKDKFLEHSIKMLVTYKMMVELFKKSERRGVEFIRNIAISHGLLGISEMDFEMMNLHLTRYLLRRNLINDESIITIVGFLSTVTKEVGTIQAGVRRNARKSIVQKINVVGKGSPARENYKNLRKWHSLVEVINGYVSVIRTQINKNLPKDDGAESTTLNSQILREKDFLLRLFAKKKPVEKK